MDVFLATLLYLSALATGSVSVAQTGVRLVGGADNCRGRVEVFLESGSYQPACSTIATDNEAKVICRMIAGCPSEDARRVSLNNFDKPTTQNSTSHPFNYICKGDEIELQSCYVSKGKVCRQGNNNANSGDIAIECEEKREVNVLLTVIVVLIVVIFISLPIITYSCLKCFEWIDNQ